MLRAYRIWPSFYGQGVFNGGYVDHDLNIWNVSSNTGGGNSGAAAVAFSKNAFTGFDVNNNPTWASDPTQGPSGPGFTTQPLPPLFPAIAFNNAKTYNLVEPLANGIVPVYNGEGYYNNPQGFHLGGFDPTTGNIKFMAHPPQPANNGQPFSAAPA
jgi:hypothetical protein